MRSTALDHCLANAPLLCLALPAPLHISSRHMPQSPLHMHTAILHWRPCTQLYCKSCRAVTNSLCRMADVMLIATLSECVRFKSSVSIRRSILYLRTQERLQAAQIMLNHAKKRLTGSFKDCSILDDVSLRSVKDVAVSGAADIDRKRRAEAVARLLDGVVTRSSFITAVGKGRCRCHRRSLRRRRNRPQAAGASSRQAGGALGALGYQQLRLPDAAQHAGGAHLQRPQPVPRVPLVRAEVPLLPTQSSQQGLDTVQCITLRWRGARTTNSISTRCSHGVLIAPNPGTTARYD